MTNEWTPILELLAQELKSLIGWGAKRHHVIARPTLRGLVVRRYPDVEQRCLGQAIVEAIKEAVKRLPEAEAEACKSLLMLNHRWDRNSAPARREFAISKLQLKVGEAAYRRADSEELDLMRVLARELLVLLTPEEDEDEQTA